MTIPFAGSSTMPWSRSPGRGIKGWIHRVIDTFGMIRRGTLTLILLVLPLAPGSAVGDSVMAVPADDILSIVNHFRSREGLPTLVHSSQLERAALAHAVWMAGSRLYGHTGAEGTLAVDRVRLTGYEACFVIESLASRTGSARMAAHNWINAEVPLHMKSWPPRDRLLDPDVREGGVAGARNDRNEWYWVLVMAAPCQLRGSGQTDTEALARSGH